MIVRRLGVLEQSAIELAAEKHSVTHGCSRTDVDNVAIQQVRYPKSSSM